MYYGPILGGLPIEAWHCEVCGLLRLTYPDGRREERRLWPGPQPGLIALPVADVRSPEHVGGRQARVSGITAPLELFDVIAPPAQPFSLSLPRLPDLGLVTWCTVLLLAGVAGGLLLGAILATYTYTLPDVERPLFFGVLGAFGAALGLQIGHAALRHFFPMPPLRPSPAESFRGEPRLDGLTRLVVVCLACGAAALLLGAILAVYTYTLPGAVKPLFFGGLALFGLALALELGDALRRYFRGR
jgi:hypothetical protein